MKALAWILTAAAVLIGADVFVMSSDPAKTDTVVVDQGGPIALHGGSGMPTPPPDFY